MLSTESFRETGRMMGWQILLYPLGFLPPLAFGARFLLQWLDSERHGECRVSRLFWQLSLIGNVLLLVHSIIQVQYHVALVQSANAVISWRNLDLMRPAHRRHGFTTVMIALFTALVVPTAIFLLRQQLFPGGSAEWFRVPTLPWQQEGGVAVAPFWHAVGCVGLCLFSSRFWIQWWYAERHHSSILNPAFWWASLAGGVLTLIYFAQIRDPVNLIGPAFGIIPYLRNLMIINRLWLIPSSWRAR